MTCTAEEGNLASEVHVCWLALMQRTCFATGNRAAGVMHSAVAMGHWDRLCKGSAPGSAVYGIAYRGCLYFSMADVQRIEATGAVVALLAPASVNDTVRTVTDAGHALRTFDDIGGENACGLERSRRRRGRPLAPI